MKQQSITNLPVSPDAERHSRMIKYSIMMGIRMVCLIVAALFVRGWWIAIPAAGAIFLPYFAVVVANVSSGSAAARVERPGNIVPVVAPETSRPDDRTAPEDSESGSDE
jgi:Protein of unknown function (DUF3099)